MTARSRARRGVVRVACFVATLAWISPIATSAAGAPADTEYAYRSQAHDTLIGLSRRLLRDPARWTALQKKNSIADPTRIPVGRVILIPRDWLRQRPETASVMVVVGSASSDGGEIQVGDALREGASVGTAPGGYVTLRLADGSVVTLNESSTLKLERMQRYDGTGVRDTGLKLESGSLDTHVTPQGAAGRFEIRSPVAISAVRGTELRSAFDAPGARDKTEVIGGAVAVAGAGAAVVVPSGFGTISEAGAGPREPTRLPEPPDLTGLPARMEGDELRVAFPPVPGIARYRARLATDPEFHEVRADRVSEAAEVLFPAVPDGPYWLQVRSVDRDGLEGRDAVHPFDRHRLLSAPEPSEPRTDAVLTGEGAELRWTAVGSAAAYRFQLARDPGFADPVTDRDRVAAAELRLPSLPRGTYYWRIASVDAAGGAGPWNQAQRFLLRPAPGPITDAHVLAKSVEVRWPGAPGQQFLVQVAREPGFERVIDQRVTDAPEASLPRHGAGTYYVRVQATDADGYVGPFTPGRRFFVPLPWWTLAAPLLLIAFL